MAVPHPICSTVGEVRPWKLKSRPPDRGSKPLATVAQDSVVLLTYSPTVVPRGTCPYSYFVAGVPEAREESPIAEPTHPESWQVRSVRRPLILSTLSAKICSFWP